MEAKISRAPCSVSRVFDRFNEFNSGIFSIACFRTFAYLSACRKLLKKLNYSKKIKLPHIDVILLYFILNNPKFSRQMSLILTIHNLLNNILPNINLTLPLLILILVLIKVEMWLKCMLSRHPCIRLFKLLLLSYLN